MTFAALALQNLLSPMVLFFVLGAALSLARSDLAIPGSIAKLLSLYLMMSIGFRGGAEVAHHGLSPTLGAAMAAGLALSFGIPFVAYGLLRTATRLPAVDAGGTPPGTDPIKLGSSNILTFTALGTSSSGSLYVRGRRNAQYVIRILGETGRVRVLKFDSRAQQWKPA